MSVVGNERTKLTARYRNGIAVAVFGLGAFALLVALTGGGGDRPRFVMAIGGACILASVAVHLAGRRLLRRLTEGCDGD